MTSPGTLNRELAGLRLASFWNESMAPESRDVVESLLEISTQTKVYGDFENTRKLLEGQTGQTVEKIWIPFDPRNVAQLGGDLQLRILENTGTPTAPVYVAFMPTSYGNSVQGHLLNDENNVTIEAQDGFFLIYPDADTNQLTLTTTDLYPRYMVPIPDDLNPQSILGTRVLVAGLDFTKGDGCLIFWESPDVLFPDFKMLVLTGRRLARNIFSYTWRLDQLYTPGYYVARYLRDMQSVGSLKLALAEVAGVAIIPWDSTLRSVLVINNETQYTFDKGMIRVKYPHTQLVPGTVFSADTLIGDGVQVYGPNGDSSWYAQADFSNGMSLDGLCPFNGLSIQLGSDGHLEFQSPLPQPYQVMGDADAVAKYWNYVTQVSALCGHHIVDAGVTHYVNAFPFLFQYLWDQRALIIHIDDSLGQDAVARAKEFLDREKPIGSVIIFV